MMMMILIIPHSFVFPCFAQIILLPPPTLFLYHTHSPSLSFSIFSIHDVALVSYLPNGIIKREKRTGIILKVKKMLIRKIKIQLNLSQRTPSNNDHLPIAIIILDPNSNLYNKNLPVNNGRKFGVPRVVAVQKFDLMLNFISLKKSLICWQDFYTFKYWIMPIWSYFNVSNYKSSKSTLNYIFLYSKSLL